VAIGVHPWLKMIAALRLGVETRSRGARSNIVPPFQGFEFPLAINPGRCPGVALGYSSVGPSALSISVHLPCSRLSRQVSASAV
jgi:hypothetical protein